MALNAERLQAVQLALGCDPIFGSDILSEDQREVLSTLFTNKTVELYANKLVDLHGIIKQKDPLMYMAFLTGEMKVCRKTPPHGEFGMRAPCIVRVHLCSRLTVCACI